MKYFRRKECGFCGRRAAVRLIHGRAAKSPHKKVWLYIIHCPKCDTNGVAKASDDKEFAKSLAVEGWNIKQALNRGKMNRLLDAIFGGDGDV